MSKKEPKAKAQEFEMDDHELPLEEVFKRYDVDPEKGITAESVDSRVAKEQKRTGGSGKNSLTPPKQTPEWVKFLQEMSNPFAILLWVGSALCFIAYALDSTGTENLYLGIVLGTVNFFTGCFSYYQNRQSSNAMAALTSMAADQCTVRRQVGGVVKEYKIDAVDLCKGDIVKVDGGQGEKVPADIRMVSVTNFKVDNSSLTGESEEQPRGLDCTHKNPLETMNIAFFGTLAVNGNCVAIVVNIGDHTVIGHIAKLTTGQATEETTLHKEIHHFILVISVIAMILGVGFFVIGMIIHPGTDFMARFVPNLVFAIGIIVANVPEGLLTTVTVSLTLTALRMKKKEVLVKNLETVETLGSCSCICSDKTGTLTMNQMTASHMWVDGDKMFNLSQDHLNGGKVETNSATFQLAHKCVVLCNDAAFEDTPENMKQAIVNRKCVGGNASDHGLLKFGEMVKDGAVNQIRKDYPVHGEGTANPGRVPFSSKYKFALKIVRQPNSGKPLLLMKGAPEQVFERCSHIMVGGQPKSMSTVSGQRVSQEWQAKFEKANDTFAGMGERVLGFASLELSEYDFPKDFKWQTEDPYNFPVGATSGPTVSQRKLCFLGCISMIDPPRPGVPAAISKCDSAGIQVIMVTGDQPATAKAIAQQIGIIQGLTKEDLQKQRKCSVEEIDTFLKGQSHEEKMKLVPAIVVHGDRLKDMSEEELGEILCDYKQIVFARTTPTQKLRIAERNKALNRICAMTGDGVNDAPALKAANIGVAMGLAGTQVAKQAADMILANDDFAAIVNAVEEGRLIFDNLKKSIAYTLTSNIPEISPFLLFVVFSMPLPLSTVLILCIDLGTDILPAISYAHEPPELDIMQRRPRHPTKDRLVTGKLIVYAYLLIGVVQALAGFYTYFLVMYDFGFAPGGLVGLTKAKFWLNDVEEDDESVPFDADADNALRWITNGEGGLSICGRLGNTAKLSVFRTQFESVEGSDAYNALLGNFNIETGCSGDQGSLFTAAHFHAYCSRVRRADIVASGATLLDIGIPNSEIGALPGDIQTKMKNFFHLDSDFVLKETDRGGALFERDEEGLPNCFTQGSAVVNSDKRIDPLVFQESQDKTKEFAFFLPYGSYRPDGQDRTDKAAHDTKCSFVERSTVAMVRSGKPADWPWEFNKSSRSREMPGEIGSHVCHSVDALKFAQTGFLVAIIIVQFSNLWFCKTRKLSLLQQGLVNMFQNLSVLSEFGLALVLCYAEFAHVVFNTRALVPWHFCVPGMPFAVYEFVFDELRKYLLRQGDPDAARLGKLTLKEDGVHYWVYSHTYY